MDWFNQMGASLADISTDWVSLWIQTGAYAVLAMLAAPLVAAKESSDET
jgi:ABC-2 type transport system permease protein